MSLVASLLAVLGSCAPDSARETRSNVLLVTFDTTRADRIGCLGGPAGTTPSWDALADRGVLFTLARTTTPLTLAAHASLFTGLVPPHHGVRGNGHYRLPEETETIATRLGEDGWATAAFVGAFVLDAQFGLARGFGVYDDSIAPAGDPHSYEERRAGDVADAAIAWLEHATTPFFLWVHFFDPHAPYEPPEPWASRFADDPYQGEIAYADHQLARLLAALQHRDLQRSTFVCVTADHGEALGEHGEETHGHLLYEGTVRVPLVLSHPSLTPAVVDEPVSIVDVAPTVLAFAGLEPPALCDGRDLLAVPSAVADAAARGYLETTLPRDTFGFAPLRGLWQGPLKLVDCAPPELYDIHADRVERDDLASGRPAVVAALRRQLDALAHSERSEATLALDADERRRIESLGYVLGHPDAPVTRPGWSPRELLELVAVRDQGRLALDAGRLEEAAGHFADLVALSPESAAGHESLGIALARLGRTQEAADHLTRAIALQFERDEAHWNLAVCHYLLGDPERAEAEARSTLALNPKHRQALRRLAQAALERGQPEVAAGHVAALLELGGDTEEVAWARLVAPTLSGAADPR